MTVAIEFCCRRSAGITVLFCESAFNSVPSQNRMSTAGNLRGAGMAASVTVREMAAGGGEAVSVADQNLDALLGEQVGALYRNAAPGTYGSLFAGAILSSMLYLSGAIPLWSMLTFNIILCANSIARLILLHTYRKKKPPLAEWRKWARAVTASALGGGVCWGLSSVLLMDPSRVEFQFIVVLACAGLSAGSIAAFGTYLPAYYVSLFPMMVPTVIWSAYQNDPIHWTYAILGSLWIVIMALVAKRFSRSLLQSLRLQFENLALANDLRLQKESAEDANMAKSRFLAAASHDLRQPVHALEMFVGALASQPMSEQGENLVRQIGASRFSAVGNTPARNSCPATSSSRSAGRRPYAAIRRIRWPAIAATTSISSCTATCRTSSKVSTSMPSSTAGRFTRPFRPRPSSMRPASAPPGRRSPRSPSRQALDFPGGRSLPINAMIKFTAV